MKRMFDFVIAALALIPLLPFLALFAIWVKLDSPGPVFYRGVRAGLNGKPFRIFKFRTMVKDAERLGGAETATDDPRITRAGAFLREYKLDELPQLINVALGDMSLVGPRPEVMEEVVKYTDEEKLVLSVRPGITDWASLTFHHEGEILKGSCDPHLTYHQKIRPMKLRLQAQYVNSNSLLTDVKIIISTLRVIISKPSQPNTP